LTIVKRNPDGTIAPGGKELTSEQASRISKVRHSAERQEKIDLLLEDLNVNPETASQVLVQLAELVVGGKSGSIPALRLLLDLTSAKEEIASSNKEKMVELPESLVNKLLAIGYKKLGD